MLAEMVPIFFEDRSNRQETAPTFLAYTPSMKMSYYCRSLWRRLEPFHRSL